MKKNLLLTGVSALALVAGKSAANAADLRAPAYKAPLPAPAPVFSWTGCYVGPHIGWGWSHKSISATAFGSGSDSSGHNTGSIDASGPVYGSQVGCNYQFAGSSWVVGIQGDYAATDINGQNIDPINQVIFGGPDNDARSSVKIDWLASITGRIGWAATGIFTASPTLFYFKGGGAWVQDKWNINDSINPEVKQTRSGWTLGAGIETVIFGNWTAFTEIDYYDFGSKSFDIFQSSGGPIVTYDVRQTMWESKIGVNYKFY
jgi:outer membrane immunogenic protein